MCIEYSGWDLFTLSRVGWVRLSVPTLTLQCSAGEPGSVSESVRSLNTSRPLLSSVADTRARRWTETVQAMRERSTLVLSEKAQVETLSILGYHIARMRYAIILALEAVVDFKLLKANLCSTLREALKTRLRVEPAKGQQKPNQTFAWAFAAPVSAPGR